MRKIFSAIVLATLAIGLVVAPVVLAAPPSGIPDSCNTELSSVKLTDECDTFKAAGTCDPSDQAGSPNCGFCCTMNTIYKITNWLFYILILLVTIFIIYGGFVIITASGDPEKAGKGRQILTYAIVGLAIALLARVIPSLVRFIIGV